MSSKVMMRRNALFWQRMQVTKVTFLGKEQNVSFPLTSMEYHDVLPNISLRKMSLCIRLGLEE